MDWFSPIRQRSLHGAAVCDSIGKRRRHWIVNWRFSQYEICRTPRDVRNAVRREVFWLNHVWKFALSETRVIVRITKDDDIHRGKCCDAFYHDNYLSMKEVSSITTELLQAIRQVLAASSRPRHRRRHHSDDDRHHRPPPPTVIVHFSQCLWQYAIRCLCDVLAIVCAKYTISLEYLPCFPTARDVFTLVRGGDSEARSDARVRWCAIVWRFATYRGAAATRWRRQCALCTQDLFCQLHDTLLRLSTKQLCYSSQIVLMCRFVRLYKRTILNCNNIDYCNNEHNTVAIGNRKLSRFAIFMKYNVSGEWFFNDERSYGNESTGWAMPRHDRDDGITFETLRHLTMFAREALFRLLFGNRNGKISLIESPEMFDSIHWLPVVLTLFGYRQPFAIAHDCRRSSDVDYITDNEE